MAFTIPREGEPERHPGGQSSGENSLSPLPEPTATVSQYLTTWLTEIAKPSLELSTYSYYETMARRYIVPALGMRHLDKVRPQDVQAWLDQLSTTCQCCAPKGEGRCPPQTQATLLRGRSVLRIRASRRTIQAARNTLRTALNHARASSQPSRVPSSPTPRSRARLRESPNGPAWTAAEANRFLSSARDDNDPFYAARVLILINALSRAKPSASSGPARPRPQRARRQLAAPAHRPTAPPQAAASDRRQRLHWCCVLAIPFTLPARASASRRSSSTRMARAATEGESSVAAQGVAPTDATRNSGVQLLRTLDAYRAAPRRAAEYPCSP